MTLFYIFSDGEEENEIDIVWPEDFEVPRAGDLFEIGEEFDSVKLTVHQVSWRVFNGGRRTVQLYVGTHHPSWSREVPPDLLRRKLEKAGMLR